MAVVWCSPSCRKGESTVVVLDKTAHIRFAKEGALTQDEVKEVMTLLHSLLQP
ncbi:hypothetical protein CRX72_05740 [Pantoea sp. BRM17]|nr:hypothetical protein CRX72_05740 [Pantoea sp. BRM17]